CYVIENKKLLGIVTAKSLLLNDENTLIGDLMETHIISVRTHDDQEEVSKLFQKYRLISIPVVDTENCMVGIVTFDDAMEVYQEEMAEDISLMAAVQPSDIPCRNWCSIMPNTGFCGCCF
ncbi:MAG: CBS domain-containing protein, partial [Holdemania filiformis]